MKKSIILALMALTAVSASAQKKQTIELPSWLSNVKLSGYLPVGQEILVNLKGLYIGSYKKLPQIGGVNTKLSDGSLGMGKIERAVWNQHFKILNPGEADATTVVPEEFDLTKLTDAAYMDANVCKLMTLKKVKFASANGRRERVCIDL